MYFYQLHSPPPLPLITRALPSSSVCIAPALSCIHLITPGMKGRGVVGFHRRSLTVDFLPIRAAFSASSFARSAAMLFPMPASLRSSSRR